MRYTIALLLVACSSQPAPPDAYREPRDGGPPVDADRRTCETSCTVAPRCGLPGLTSQCDGVAFADNDFCAECRLVCPDGYTESCETDHLFWCNGPSRMLPLGCVPR